MTFFLSYWKYLVILALLAGAYSAGWYKEHIALVEYKATIAALGQAQEAQTKAKEAEYEHNTEVIADSYSSELERLQHNADSRKLSKTPIGSKSSNGASGEPSRACKSSEFYDNALKDALTLKAWQDWAVKQGIPVN